MGMHSRTSAEKRNMSLGDLGTVLGVSRRTISKYESGMGTTLEIAIRLEEVFNARSWRRSISLATTRQSP